MSSSRARQRTSRSTTDSLDRYIASLRAHLESRPIWNALPAALEIFAHFQLLSEAIKEQARIALDLQEDLAEELEAEGIPQKQWVARGALETSEGKRITAWKRRDKEDTMFALSLGIRKHHIARELSLMDTDPSRTRALIDDYFPDITTDEASEHERLFVRCMRPDDFGVLKIYRKEVMGWYRQAKVQWERHRSPPTYDGLIEGNAKAKFQMLLEKLLREAERCLADAKEFEAMFKETWTESAGSSLRTNRRGEGRTGAIRPEDRWNAKSEDEEDLSAQRRARRTTLPAPPPASDVARIQQATRPRTSLPAHLSRRSPSPTPEHLASLPRLNFGGKRPSVTRSSADRSMTPMSPLPYSGPIPDRPLFMPGPSSDIDEPSLDYSDTPVASTSTIKRPGPPPIYASRSIIPSSGLKPSPTALTAIASTSAAAPRIPKQPAKKRYSGAGPDFTAPLPTPKRSWGDMKPFSTAELHAGKRKSLLATEVSGQDENSPRVAKKRVVTDTREALGSGESQENSQESAKSIEVVVKRDKGKQRAVPRPTSSEMQIGRI